MRCFHLVLAALLLAPDGHAQGTRGATLAGGATRDVTVGTLRVRVSGVIEFPEGAPAEAVTVSCGATSALTDAAGAFELEFQAGLGTALVLEAETRRVGARYLASTPLLVSSSTLSVGVLVLTRTTPPLDFVPLVHGGGFSFLVSGDFDLDGDVDFVAGQGTTRFVVLLNEASGFQEWIESGVNVRGLQAFDLELDGDLDLLIDHPADAQGRTCSAFFNDGRGDFGPAVGISAGTAIPGDFDGDGIPDLVSGLNGTLGFRRGVGDGTFDPPVMQVVPIAFGSLVAARLDGDGVLDLAMVGGSSLVVAIGDGSGAFTTLAPVPLVYSGSELDVGDVDGDGDQDLVVRTLQGSSTFHLEVFRGAGDGTFTAMAPAAGYNRNVVLGDLDGDGDDDLVQLETISGIWSVGLVHTRRSQGNGHFTSGFGYTLGTSVAAVTLTDFDDDGTRDVVVVSDSLVILPGKGDTSLEIAEFASGADEINAAADHDGDGDLDLLLTDFVAGRVQLSRNSGSSSFVPVGPFLTISHPLYSAAGDLDGDGDLDVAVAHDTSVETLRTGPTLSLQFLETLAVGSNPVPTLGDFDHDGDLDLAVSAWAAPGTVYLYPGQGDGTLGARTAHTTGGQPRTLVASDWNTDGALDLAVQTQSPLQLVFRAGNGDGTFKPATQYPNSGRLLGASSAADLNGDGHLDLLTKQDFLLGHGNGLFDPAVSFGMTADAIRDLDGDGRIDLLRTSFGTFEVFPGLGDGTFGPRRLSLWPFEPGTSVEPFPGDFDGDGDLDVLLDNGLYAVWMRGRRLP